MWGVPSDLPHRDRPAARHRHAHADGVAYPSPARRRPAAPTCSPTAASRRATAGSLAARPRRRLCDRPGAGRRAPPAWASCRRRRISTPTRRPTSVTLPAGADHAALLGATGGATDGVDARARRWCSTTAPAIYYAGHKTPGDDTWRQRSFDLSAYAGQRDCLFQRLQRRRNGRAWNYLDSVEVLACTGNDAGAHAHPIATPTATPTPVVTPTPDPRPRRLPPAAIAGQRRLRGGERLALRLDALQRRVQRGAPSTAARRPVRLGIPAAAANRRAYSTVWPARRSRRRPTRCC